MSRPGARIWGMGAEFDTVKDVFHAAEQVRDLGFQRWDVHSPFPIHGMDDAMGLGRSRLSFFSLVGGATGFTIAFLMIYLTSGAYHIPGWFDVLPVWAQPAWGIQNELDFNYPLIVHGKPYFALPPSFPIFFELTVLLTAFASIFALMAMTMLPRWNHPLFTWTRFKQVTDDKFYIVIEASDPRFSEVETREMMSKIGGKHITLIEED